MGAGLAFLNGQAS